jgi:hypothetical protein
MRPVDIKYALATAEPEPFTQTEVAISCGVSKSMVYDVIHSNRRNQRVANRIAVITGLPLAELWPQWYGPEAQRRRARNRPSPHLVAEALRAFVG